MYEAQNVVVFAKCIFTYSTTCCYVSPLLVTPHDIFHHRCGILKFSVKEDETDAKFLCISTNSHQNGFADDRNMEYNDSQVLYLPLI